MAEALPGEGLYNVFAVSIEADNAGHLAGVSTQEGRYVVYLGVTAPIEPSHPEINRLSNWASTDSRANAKVELGYRASGFNVEGESLVLQPGKEAPKPGSIIRVGLNVPQAQLLTRGKTDEQCDRDRKTWSAETIAKLWETAGVLEKVVADALNRHADPEANVRHLTRLGHVAVPRPETTAG